MKHLGIEKSTDGFDVIAEIAHTDSRPVHVTMMAFDGQIFSPHASNGYQYVFQNVAAHATFVLVAQFQHWVPDLPCFGAESYTIGVVSTP